MIDRKMVLGAVGIALTGIAIGFGIGKSQSTVSEPGVKPFKDSMRERYKHLHDLKLKTEQKEEAFERVRDSVKRDIRELFGKDHQLELLDYSDKLWTEFYNKTDK